MFLGMPTYGSTQTIFGQLSGSRSTCRRIEYVEWPPVTTIEALIPGEFRTRLALPWGGFPHPVWFKDDPRIANVYAFGGLLDRSLMENVVAGQRDYQEKIRPLPSDEQRKILAGIADSVQAGMPPRENRRRQRTINVVSARGSLESIQVVVHGAGCLPPDRPDPGVRRASPRLPAAARGRLRVAVLGVRAPRTAGCTRSLRARPAESSGLIKVGRRREAASRRR